MSTISGNNPKIDKNLLNGFLNYTFILKTIEIKNSCITILLLICIILILRSQNY